MLSECHQEILTTELAEFGALLRKDLRDDAENPLRLVRCSEFTAPGHGRALLDLIQSLFLCEG